MKVVCINSKCNDSWWVRNTGFEIEEGIVYDVVNVMCYHDSYHYMIGDMWYLADCFLTLKEYRDRKLNKILYDTVL